MRKNILCIDDDPEAAALMENELRGRGFAVSVAHSGSEGLLAIMKSTPDLVVCDVAMPTMTGFDVMDRLNEFAPRIGQVPIVLVMSEADGNGERGGRRLRVHDYVTKPIDFDQLVYVIYAQIIQKARSEGPQKVSQLNEQEIAVLTRVARGKTSAEIARDLRMAKRTVDYHVDNAKLKLRAGSRTEAVIKATANGLIEL